MFDNLVEGSLKVKLPTICRDKKAEVGSVSQEKSRSEKIEMEKVRREKMQVREKVRSRDSLCFSDDLGLQRVEKQTSLKRRVRSQLAR